MQNIQAYRNLNKPGVMFSIRQKGLVREWWTGVEMTGVTFKHASAKQQSAARRSRLVCQWVKAQVGVEIVGAPVIPSHFVRVDSDPKTTDGFQVDGVRVEYAERAILCSTGLWIEL